MGPRLVRALAALVLASGVAAAVAVPPLTRRVTDLTGTLTAAQADALERRLAEFEREKGSQVAVLVVPTTGPETIEAFGIRVVDAWKLGRSGVGDGVLLLVARNDRTLRLEVGRGLEGALPDAVAKRIIEDVIVPRFKAGDLPGGIAAGIDATLRVVAGEPLPAPARRSAPMAPDAVPALLVIGLVVVTVVGGILRVLFGRLVGATIVGTIVGVLAWVLVASLLAAMVAGLVAFLATLLGVTPRAGRGRHADAWDGGGGGGGDGGGGFSGGGGDFAGGGASGRW